MSTNHTIFYSGYFFLDPKPAQFSQLIFACLRETERDDTEVQTDVTDRCPSMSWHWRISNGWLIAIAQLLISSMRMLLTVFYGEKATYVRKRIEKM